MERRVCLDEGQILPLEVSEPRLRSRRALARHHRGVTPPVLLTLRFSGGAQRRPLQPVVGRHFARLRVADPHFQPRARLACWIHLRIKGPCASSSVFSLT